MKKKQFIISLMPTFILSVIACTLGYIFGGLLIPSVSLIITLLIVHGAEIFVVCIDMDNLIKDVGYRDVGYVSLLKMLKDIDIKDANIKETNINLIIDILSNEKIPFHAFKLGFKKIITCVNLNNYLLNIFNIISPKHIKKRYRDVIEDSKELFNILDEADDLGKRRVYHNLLCCWYGTSIIEINNQGYISEKHIETLYIIKDKLYIDLNNIKDNDKLDLTSTVDDFQVLVKQVLFDL